MFEDSNPDLQACMKQVLREQPSEEEKACAGQDQQDDVDEVPQDDEGEENASVLVSGNDLDEEDDYQSSSESEFSESWYSGDSDSGNSSDSDDDVSAYGCREEERFILQQEMGFDKFTYTYNKIKALCEARDNSDVHTVLKSILGLKHRHLFFRTICLLEAYGVFQEDNDE